jgi:sterol desaturase/sphingolipid hydroxylase (fatty acid hydroxylase superfamily)
MIFPILNGNHALLNDRGMKLGAFSALASAVMDQEQVSFHDGRSYSESWTLVLFNLLFLGPVFYTLVTPLLSLQKRFLKNIFDIFGLITIHSAVYSFVHRLMHKVTAFRPIHKHHHKYKEIVLPSNANAVSSNEFIFAYMLPFVVGCALIKPTSHSLSVATLIVSGFNICIHSVSLSKYKWFKWFVTPSEHLHHHETKSSIYSAPTISWGKIFKKK